MEESKKITMTPDEAISRLTKCIHNYRFMQEAGIYEDTQLGGGLDDRIDANLIAVQAIQQIQEIRKIIGEYKEDRWTDEVDPYLKRIIEVIKE